MESEVVKQPHDMPPSPIHAVTNFCELLDLEFAIQSDSFEFLRHVVIHGNTIAFQIEIGLPGDADPLLISRPLRDRDVPIGLLHLAQLKGRSLPVAAARFADQIQSAFAEGFDCV